MNCPSATSTSASAGSDAATRPTSGDTWGPIATHSSGTCSSRAHTDRAAVIVASKSCGWDRPVRQFSAAAENAAHAVSGGRPQLAVFR